MKLFAKSRLYVLLTVPCIFFCMILTRSINGQDSGVSGTSCQDAIKAYVGDPESEDKFISELSTCNSAEQDWVELSIYDGLSAGDSGTDGIFPVAAYRGHKKLIQHLLKITSASHLRDKMVYTKIIRGLSRISGPWNKNHSELLKFAVAQGGKIEIDSIYSAVRACKPELLAAAKSKGYLKPEPREKAQLIDITEDALSQTKLPDAKAACTPGYSGALKCYDATQCKAVLKFFK